MNIKSFLKLSVMLSVGVSLWLIATPPSFATFPGANGKIAFARNPGNGNFQIYVMNHDGSELTNLTNNTAYYEPTPVWSPDGAKLAFTSNRSGNFDIWVMNADGTGPRNLTSPSTASESDPAWSPDGNKIVFRRGVGVTTNLWIMDADRSNQCQRTFNTAQFPSPFGPDWSPDGSQIAFAQSLSNSQTEIYLVNPNCFEQPPQITQITNNGINSMRPSWSPDGTQKIVFERGPAGSSQVWVMVPNPANPNGPWVQTLLSTTSSFINGRNQSSAPPLRRPGGDERIGV